MKSRQVDQIPPPQPSHLVSNSPPQHQPLMSNSRPPGHVNESNARGMPGVCPGGMLMSLFDRYIRVSASHVFLVMFVCICPYTITGPPLVKSRAPWLTHISHNNIIIYFCPWFRYFLCSVRVMISVASLLLDRLKRKAVLHLYLLASANRLLLVRHAIWETFVTKTIFLVHETL